MALGRRVRSIGTGATKVDRGALALLLGSNDVSTFDANSHFNFVCRALNFAPISTTVRSSARKRSIKCRKLLRVGPRVLFIVSHATTLKATSSRGTTLLRGSFICRASTCGGGGVVGLSSSL